MPDQTEFGKPRRTQEILSHTPTGWQRRRMRDSITVRVPGTTANIGPGFDCLGAALDVYNFVTVARSESPTDDAMFRATAAAFFKKSGQQPFSFSCEIAGDVPRSRGMGSSVTVRLGIGHGLNSLAGSPLTAQALYLLCAELEGHPDNAAPAALGGFTIARNADAVLRYSISEALSFVLLIPDYEVRTDDARRVLPKTIPFTDAVRSAANAATIAAAFASENYAALTDAFDDFLHQPYRASLVPGLTDILAAGREAGALGGWLSGSGSTIACLTLGNPEPVAAAMLAADPSKNSKTHIAKADNAGVRIENGEP